MAQGTACLPSKCKALNSNPSTTKKKQNERKKMVEEGPEVRHFDWGEDHEKEELGRWAHYNERDRLNILRV
jgi:hypothetical protein